jgi:SAM-dependent methyltransferase
VNGEEHWDERYRADLDELSWYQAEPAVSLALMDELGVAPAASVLDVGGGASTLVDHLLRRGHRDLAVLDLSDRALAVARERTGDPAGVTWIGEDLCTWNPPRRWDVWHDRALLHFLVDDTDRARYVEIMRRAIEPGGVFVIGTFAEDGPTRCSGLPVRRYSARDLAVLLDGFEVVARRREVHVTPGGADQPFTWVAGRVPGGR